MLRGTRPKEEDEKPSRGFAITKFFTLYLSNFPMFIFTDILLPLLVVFLWHDLKEQPGDGIE